MTGNGKDAGADQEWNPGPVGLHLSALQTEVPKTLRSFSSVFKEKENMRGPIGDGKQDFSFYRLMFYQLCPLRLLHCFPVT